MSIKRVIITGAGFSSPAKLPIQNKILDLMKEKPVSSFMDDSDPNSFKFMNAYIVVGLYLLDMYSKNSFDELSLLYKEIQKKSCENNFIESILNDFISNKIEVGIDALDYLNKRCFDSTHKYKELNKLVDLIRNALNVEKIDVNLEDVFTSFDKSLQEKEYMDKYSYLKMDSIRLSLTRLFVYYFYQEVHKHNYDTEDYLNFIKYIKTRRSNIPLTIITTNWDTLLEEYFIRNNISYNLCLNEKYYFEDDLNNNENPNGNDLKLVKVHGSINWFRCLNCNTLSIYKKIKISDLLFNDEKYESCLRCNIKVNEETEVLQPEIITPTMIKSIDSQLYKNLWNTASNELRNADEIIFIGYSMPIADYEFRYLLQKSIPAEAKIDVILHSSDDPSKTKSNWTLLPEKRYRDLFSKNTINFHYEGFKEFLN